MTKKTVVRSGKPSGKWGRKYNKYTESDGEISNVGTKDYSGLIIGIIVVVILIFAFL